MSITRMIRANDPADLELSIGGMLSRGWDLHGTLLVSDPNEVGQWMVDIPTTSEYRLIIADSLDELATKCERMTNQGWDFWYGDCRWGGKLLQWMMRSKSLPLSVEAGHFFSKRVVVSSTPVNAANYHWVTGGARSFRMPIPSILEG